MKKLGISLPSFGESSPVGVMETQTTNALFMSERGEISCLPHAPFPGTDSWDYDRWAPITKREAQAFERDIGRAPACETCAAMARNGPTR